MKLNFDVSVSGTTAVTILIIEGIIYCANIGDSRAIIGCKKVNSKWECKALSRDHKANEKIEMDRIIAHGGRL